MPIHTYTNWNTREMDKEDQIEPFRKYFVICEGANTETFYFKKLIDMRKELGISQLIDIRLWKKTGSDRDISFAKNLVAFAMSQKNVEANDFDSERDKLIIVFDADIFEKKVSGYDELVAEIEENDIAAVTNPAFELFLILHLDGSYDKYIRDHEDEFFIADENGSYRHAYEILHNETEMNSKKNPKIGDLAENVMTAIKQEKYINQDIHHIKGKVSSNIGLVIESILNERGLQELQDKKP